MYLDDEFTFGESTLTRTEFVVETIEDPDPPNEREPYRPPPARASLLYVCTAAAIQVFSGWQLKHAHAKLMFAVNSLAAIFLGVLDTCGSAFKPAYEGASHVYAAS